MLRTNLITCVGENKMADLFRKPPESPEQSQRRPGSRNDLPIGAMCVGSLLLAPPLVGTLRPKWTGRYSSGFLCHLAFNGLELLSAHVLPHSGVFSTRCGDGGTPLGFCSLVPLRSAPFRAFFHSFKVTFLNRAKQQCILR